MESTVWKPWRVFNVRMETPPRNDAHGTGASRENRVCNVLESACCAASGDAQSPCAVKAHFFTCVRFLCFLIRIRCACSVWTKPQMPPFGITPGSMILFWLPGVASVGLRRLTSVATSALCRGRMQRPERSAAFTPLHGAIASTREMNRMTGALREYPRSSASIRG